MNLPTPKELSEAIKEFSIRLEHMPIQDKGNSLERSVKLALSLLQALKNGELVSKEELKCQSCGNPMSRACPQCKKDWES